MMLVVMTMMMAIVVWIRQGGAAAGDAKCQIDGGEVFVTSFEG